jgi:tRNA 2-thiouridine synthesizing protein B
MSILHTVNRSPYERATLDSCLRFAQVGSSILLIEDAVYAAARGTAVAEKVRTTAERLRVYVLAPDLQARGLDRACLVAGVEPVDYGGFVDLAVGHDCVQAWL